MNKKQYAKKCKVLFYKAGQLGLKLIFNPDNFDCNRLNCLWYGGELATIVVSEELSIELNVYGDVNATLLDRKNNELVYVKDKNNNGRFYDEMSSLIKNDRQLNSLIKNYRLILNNNNWIEYDGVIRKGKSDTMGQFIDLGMIRDNILDDDILIAIDNVLNRHKEIVDEINECA